VHFELSKNQEPNELTKDFIIKIVQEQKPETASQLIRFVHQTTNLSEKEIMNLLNQLEAEDKIHFNMKQELSSASIGTYLFTSESAWYWIIIAVAIATTITVFTIPQDWYPLAYVRNVLGVIFVRGFCHRSSGSRVPSKINYHSTHFLNILKLPTQTSSEHF
jgi:hypothetical protein